jgi:dihydroorotate dehydrogenase (NAD+) catalytic subunit
MNSSATPDPILAADFCGMHFASPLVLLSGCVGFGEEYTRVEGFSNRDVGGICLKGTTLEPRLGNSPHRVYETPMGMLNAIGLQNPGARHVVDSILPTLDFAETRFIANISGSTLEEYVEVARIFDDSPIDAMEINIPAPTSRKAACSSATIRTCRPAWWRRYARPPPSR